MGVVLAKKRRVGRGRQNPAVGHVELRLAGRVCFQVGVFGKVTRLDSRLQPGDRVEIYRPLIADPKAQRKKRAAQGKALKKRT